MCAALAGNPDIEVIGTAPDGPIALGRIPTMKPDVVTLDVEMPGMDGIQTLKEIRRLHPTLPVIMCSAITDAGAAITLEALSLGASDYVTKPHSEGLEAAALHLRGELVARILALVPRSKIPPPHKPIFLPRRKAAAHRVDIVAIGTSTGGPNALAQVLPHLAADFPVPVVVVQHMPRTFTRLLAERLNALCSLNVREAEAGAPVRPGTVWLAPGDYHLVIERLRTGVIVGLNHDEPENSCRPAVDVLFRSVAAAFGPFSLGVVMTGMGADGARGAEGIREAGGQVFVQDEASSTVWGMPGAVVQAGAADKILPLHEIGPEIVHRVALGRVLEAVAKA